MKEKDKKLEQIKVIPFALFGILIIEGIIRNLLGDYDVMYIRNSIRILTLLVAISVFHFAVKPYLRKKKKGE